jgi:hypothetical protein
MRLFLVPMRRAGLAAVYRPKAESPPYQISKKPFRAARPTLAKPGLLSQTQRTAVPLTVPAPCPRGQIRWANSRYRQCALASRICSGVRQSASNTFGEATKTQRHWAREVATLSRFRL